MEILGYKCRECRDIVYSRARHDCRSCSCGNIFVDGGFDYTRIGYNKVPPNKVTIKINSDKCALYDDWNDQTNKYGLIKEEPDADSDIS